MLSNCSVGYPPFAFEGLHPKSSGTQEVQFPRTNGRHPFVMVVPGHNKLNEMIEMQTSGDYRAIAGEFIRTLSPRGDTDLPKTRTELHKKFEGAFRRWAEAMRIVPKIYHFILKEYETIVQERGVEPENETSSLQQPVVKKLGNKVMDGKQMEKFHPHIAIPEEGNDEVKVVLRAREVNEVRISPHLTIFVDTNPRRKKSNIAGFVIHGAREMLRAQKCKKQSIPLDKLIKRLASHCKGSEDNIFGAYERRILKIASRNEFEFWI